MLVQVGAVVDACLGIEGVLMVGADNLVAFRIPIVFVTTVNAEVGGNIGVDREVEVQDDVAAVHVGKGVVIYAFRVEVLPIIIIGVVFADGLINVVFHMGTHKDGHTDFLCRHAVADAAVEGGAPDGRRGHGILRCGAVEQVGRRPVIGVVAGVSVAISKLADRRRTYRRWRYCNTR